MDQRKRPDSWVQGSLLPAQTIRAELVVWMDAGSEQVYYGWHIATGDQLEVIEITANESVTWGDAPVSLGRIVARRMSDLRNLFDPFPA